MKNILSQAVRAALRVPLFWLSAGAALGIFAADEGGPAWWWGVAALAGFFLRKNRACWLLSLGILVSAAGFYGMHRRHVARIGSFPLLSSLGNGASLYLSGKGTVVSATEQRTGSAVRVFLELDELTIRERSVPGVAGSRVVATVDHPQANRLKYGSVVNFSGVLSLLKKARAPGAFDPYAYFYRSAGALTQLEIQAGDRCDISETERGGNPMRRAAFASRQWMEKVLLHGTESFDRQGYSGVVVAMTLGSLEYSPDDLEEFFRISGTMHIFAVSGLQVAVVAGFLWFLLKWTGLSRPKAAWILMPSILFYAMITGLSPSSYRAAIMLMALLAAFALKQRPSSINALGLAAMVLMAGDTQQLFLPGFQLSFCVVLAIMLLASPFTNWIHRPFRIDDYLPRRRAGLARIIVDQAVRFVAGTAGVSAASWLGSALLMNSHFKGLSPVGLVANIFMVPVASGIVMVAILSIAFYGIRLRFLSWFLNFLNLGLVHALTAMAQFFCSLPLAYLHTGSAPKQAEKELVSLDVMGIRGDGAILVSSETKHWLIDCGSENTFSGQVLPLLRDRGINRIEGLILTHGDSGHAGGAPYLLRHLPPRVFIRSEHPYRARMFGQVEDLLASRKIEQIRVKAGQGIRFNDDVRWKVLYPDDRDPPTNIADDRCLVLQTEAGRWRILMTADSGMLVERILLQQHQNLKADVWIRGQHSENNSSGSVDFLDRVSPRVIISTQSRFPPHERIDSAWIELLEQRGIRLFTLDEAGIVRITVTPSRLGLEPYLRPEDQVFLEN